MMAPLSRPWLTEKPIRGCTPPASYVSGFFRAAKREAETGCGTRGYGNACSGWRARSSRRWSSMRRPRPWWCRCGLARAPDGGAADAAEGAVVRPRRGPAALAGTRLGDRAGVLGGRRATSELPDAWPDGDPGALGPPRGGPHLRLRRDRRLAGHPVLQDGGGRADAHRLAHGRFDRGPGVGRHRRSRRPPRRATPHRDRRDLLQARPPLPDRRGRPRHRRAGVGRARAGRSDPAAGLPPPPRGDGGPPDPPPRRPRRPEPPRG